MAINVSDSNMAMIAQLVYLDASSEELEREYNAGKLTVSMLLNSMDNRDKFKGFSDEEITRFENECGNWKIKHEKNDPESGLYAFIVEPEPRKGIVAFRGSEPFWDNLNDWRNNATLVDEVQTMQHKSIEEYIQSGIFDEYDELGSTGHSLGGNDNNYFTTGTDSSIRDKIVISCSFNAPGFNSDYINKNKEAIEEMSGVMKNFQNEKDFVSSILYNLVPPIIMESEGFDDGYMSNHSIYQFIFNNDGTLKKKDNQQKDIPSNMVHDITIALEKMPGKITDGIVESVFNVLENDATFKDYLVTANIVYGVVKYRHLIFDGLLALAAIEGVKLAAPHIKRFAVKTLDDAKEWVAKEYNKIANSIDKFIMDSIRVGKIIDKKINDVFIKVKESIKILATSLGSVVKKFSNSISYISMESINVRTEDLSVVINKLNNVQRRLNLIDDKLNILRKQANLDDKLKIALIDLNIGQDFKINKSIRYLENTISKLNECERQALRWAASISR